MKTPHEFYKEVDGKIIDIDGAYGGQCWDLFAKFCLEYCGKTFGCIATGYVKDLWTHFDQCGLGDYFVKVPNNQLQDGDWAIHIGPCAVTNKSHISMFRIDNGNGGGTFLTQNPNGNPKYTHQMWFSYDGLVGGLRPKCYIKKAPIDKFEITEVGEDYVKVNFVAKGDPFDWARYSLNKQEWKNLPTTGIIKNLEPNTRYLVRIELRNKGTDTWTESDELEFTTKDIPKEEPKETEIDTQKENIPSENTNIPDNTETAENEPLNEKIEPNTSDKEQESQEKPIFNILDIILQFIKYIVKWIKGGK